MDEADKVIVGAIGTARAAGMAALTIVQELTYKVGASQPNGDQWLRELAGRVSARFDAQTKDGEDEPIALARTLSEQALASVAASLRKRPT